MARRKSRRREIASGTFFIYTIVDGIWTPQNVLRNTRVDTWGWIAAKALMEPNSGYWLNAMYIEYENVANAEDAVTNPTIDRTEGVEYYAGLGSDRDYLRVRMDRTPVVTVKAGFESSFAAGQGNVVEFRASTSGSTGVNGEPFSHLVNSKICGLAVVAAPDWDDPTKDLLYARKYFGSSVQRVKEANIQIGVGYKANFYDVES